MEKTDFITWLKAHKKQLVIAGIGVAAIATIVLGIKNKEAITEFWAYLESSLKKAKIPEHHSAAKATEAAAAGVELWPNQTLVDGYVKGVAA